MTFEQKLGIGFGAGLTALGAGIGAGIETADPEILPGGIGAAMFEGGVVGLLFAAIIYFTRDWNIGGE